MQELKAVFTPADGSPSREITLRIGDPKQGAGEWTAKVEILGFSVPEAIEVAGADWAQATELAARSLAELLGFRVRREGGTMEPSFFERDPPDMSRHPPEILAILGLAPDGSTLPEGDEEDA